MSGSEISKWITLGGQRIPVDSLGRIVSGTEIADYKWVGGEMIPFDAMGRPVLSGGSNSESVDFEPSQFVKDKGKVSIRPEGITPDLLAAGIPLEKIEGMEELIAVLEAQSRLIGDTE